VTEPAPGDLLAVEDLVVRFPAPGGATVHAVEGVSFQVARGRTLALVGESGSGKSTAVRAAMRLIEPTSGRITFDGMDVRAARGARLRRLRRRMQLVFQDPYSSLDPQFTIGRSVAEPLVVHRHVPGRAARRRRVEELLGLVGLDPALMDRYPRVLSGGQRQRVAIARAIALEPELLVCDEPVSALDVSIQAQILNLLMDLQDRLGLSYVVISHDLAVVSEIADWITVMYLGHVVETGPREQILGSPAHPYTAALVTAAAPADSGDPVTRGVHRIVMRGDPASPLDPPSGCVFRTRCPRAQDVCRTSPPRITDAHGRSAWCFFPVGDVRTAVPDASAGAVDGSRDSHLTAT
jgi:peptide/nickel transport system ATP-binding protein